jgi:hypothetical protein
MNQAGGMTRSGTTKQRVEWGDPQEGRAAREQAAKPCPGEALRPVEWKYRAAVSALSSAIFAQRPDTQNAHLSWVARI